MFQYAGFLLWGIDVPAYHRYLVLKVVSAPLRPLAATHVQHEFENMKMNLDGSVQISTARASSTVSISSSMFVTQIAQSRVKTHSSMFSGERSENREEEISAQQRSACKADRGFCWWWLNVGCLGKSE